jgi:hypothetical protein
MCRDNGLILMCGLLCAFALPAQAELRISAGKLSLALDEHTGRITGLRDGAHDIRVRQGQTLLEVRDIPGTGATAAVEGPVRQEGSDLVLDGSAAGLGLRASIRLRPEGEHLAILMSVSNERNTDRGLIVSMTLPLAAKDVRWSNGLNPGAVTQPGVLYGDNLYPLSAAWDSASGWGLAAAIPPTHPVMYDTRYRDGTFGIVYYVGLTPATRNFPNRAELKAIVYGVDPHWGFRSALEKYYDAYPDFYQVRARKAGLWCFNMDAGHDPLASDCTFYEAGGAEWQGDGPRGSTEGKKDKGYGRSTASTFKEWAAQNAVPEAVRNGASVYPYTIVGQRQIYQLPGKELITDYDRAMRIFHDWTIDRTIPFQNPITANSFRSVEDLKAIIENSGLHDAAGHYAILPRLYTGNTLTFPLNPNPALFRSEKKSTIAGYALDYYLAGLVRDVPEVSGVYVDSLGRWCNYVNYRRNHFGYARYPLGADAAGRPVIRSLSSHYEYLEELARRLHAGNRLLFCNGVNDGGATRPKTQGEPWDAARPASRFFLGALSDVAGSESGAKTPLARMQTFRVIMGPKPFATLAKTHADDSAMETYFKRGVMLGVFTSMGDKYYTDPAWRHNAQKAHDRYLPLLRLLHAAHWRPVFGVTGLDGVLGERFGEPGKGPVYVTLLNEGAASKDLALAFDTSVFPHKLSAAADRASADRFPIHDGQVRVAMAPGQLRVLELR